MDHTPGATTLSQQNGPIETLGPLGEQTDRSKSNNAISSSWEDTSAENSTDGLASDRTRFQLYRDYIAAILKVWPEYRGLHDYLSKHHTSWGHTPGDRKTQLVIADCTDVSTDMQVFREGDSSVGPSMLKAALNTYREDVKTRIIMISPCAWVPAEMIDALGMALDVDPAFLQVAVENINGPGAPAFEKFGQYLLFEPFMYVQLLHAQKDAATRIRVVLIFARDDLWQQPLHGMLRYGRPSIHKPVPTFPLAERGIYGLDQRVQIFEEMLQLSDSNFLESANDEPLEYLCPLIRLAIEGVSTTVSDLRLLFRHWPLNTNETITVVAESHAQTIRHVESLRHLTQTLATHCSLVASRHSGVLLDVQKYSDCVSDDAQGLCELVQGRIQIQTGLASIRESQRSIEEALSVKRLTQLAFIFIPLTYSTSLFGMNIEEMTGNGPKLWIFVLISVCISGTAFLLSSLAKRITNWIKRHYNKTPPYYLRCYILYGLIGVRFGLLWPMTRMGLTLTILTGGRFVSLDPLEYVSDEVRKKLGLSLEEDIWPPPRGFNKLYFRTKASSVYADESTGSQRQESTLPKWDSMGVS